MSKSMKIAKHKNNLRLQVLTSFDPQKQKKEFVVLTLVIIILNILFLNNKSYKQLNNKIVNLLNIYFNKKIFAVMSNTMALFLFGQFLMTSKKLLGVLKKMWEICILKI